MSKSNEIWYYQVTRAAALQEAAESTGTARRRALGTALFAARSARQLGFDIA